MEFYQGVFGGSLRLNTFGEFGVQDSPDADKIMHGMLETDSGFTLMGADTPPGMEYNPGTNIAVSLSGDDADELRGYWEKLSAGGAVSVPLESRCGAMSSGCAWTSSASAGWSTSVGHRPDPGRDRRALRTVTMTAPLTCCSGAAQPQAPATCLVVTLRRLKRLVVAIERIRAARACSS